MNITKGLNNKRCQDLRGRKFGMLTPITTDTSKNRVFWKCRCDCGTIKLVAAKHLVGNKIKSCGCNHYTTGKKNWGWKGYEDISGKYWETTRKNAIARRLEFSITPEYAWFIFVNQNRKCALTGLPLKFQTKSSIHDGNASIDRIDSSKGYVEGNIQWVHKDINTIKWDLSLDNFFKMCKLVVDFNKL